MTEARCCRLMLAQRPWGRWRLERLFDPASKRGLDVMVSPVAQILLTPLMRLVALLIKIEDERKAMSLQIRLGKHRRDRG